MSEASRTVTDISRWLTSGHPNWPGDAPYTLTPGQRIAGGDSVNTGVMATSTHTGTHVDAPWHYGDGAARLHEVPLETYVGRCVVLHVCGLNPVPASVLEAFRYIPERLLLYTGQPPQWERFPEDFAALSPELVREAARRGVRLIGTDAPSVDPLTSKTLDAHMACLEAGIAIVEGLNLASVREGVYDLTCLPLALWDADAAPARAILREVQP